MRKYLKILALAAGVLALATCDKHATLPQEPSQKATLTVSIDKPAAKAVYTDQRYEDPNNPMKVEWETDDMISVLILSDSGLAMDGESHAHYMFAATSGGGTAVFEGPTVPRALNEGEYYLIVYPAFTDEFSDDGAGIYQLNNRYCFYLEDNAETSLKLDLRYGNHGVPPKPAEKNDTHYLNDVDLMTAIVEGDFPSGDDAPHVHLSHEIGLLAVRIEDISVLAEHDPEVVITGADITMLPDGSTRNQLVYDFLGREFRPDTYGVSWLSLVYENPIDIPTDGLVFYFPVVEMNLTGGNSFYFWVTSTYVDDEDTEQPWSAHYMVEVPTGAAFHVFPGVMSNLVFGPNTVWDTGI